MKTVRNIIPMPLSTSQLRMVSVCTWPRPIPLKKTVAGVGKQTTIKKARAMLKQVGFSNNFWAKAFSTAVNLENRTLVASLKFKTPYKIWHGHSPTYNHLRVFGCLAYIHISKERWEGKFADYQESHHNYGVYLLNEKQIVCSHNVVFNESCFPLKGAHKSFKDDDENWASHDSLTQSNGNLDQNSNPESLLNVEIPLSEVSDTIVPVRIVEGDCITEPQPNSIKDKTQPMLIPEDYIVKASSEDIKSVIHVSNILPTTTGRDVHAINAIPMAVQTTTTNPKTYQQALSRPAADEWKESMQRELDNLERMGVLEEVEFPVGEHSLGTTWVYKRETNAAGKLIKYKLWLCAQWFSQVEGINYSESYGPKGRPATLRTCLSICATKDFEVIQMDALGAFLNGIPDKTLYIRPPKGYTCKSGNVNTVLKLTNHCVDLRSPCAAGPNSWNICSHQ